MQTRRLTALAALGVVALAAPIAFLPAALLPVAQADSLADSSVETQTTTVPDGEAPANQVLNPSLEEGEAWPSCFTAAGWGTEATWALVPGRESGRAVALTLAGHTSGDRKLLTSDTPECALAVTEGATYDLSLWYTSDVPGSLTMFRETEAGWTYWGDLGTQRASATWRRAAATTPPIPAGTQRIAFGLSIASDGTLVTDDYAFVPSSSVDPGTGGVGNPWLLEDGPECLVLGGWGENSAVASFSTDVPSSAPAGARSLQITMAAHVSGDAKAIQSEAPGCAPSVIPGHSYEVALDYNSTSPANALTVFSHSSSGWSYWTDVATLPATSGWEHRIARLPDIPSGVDRISFGVSTAADGTLLSTGHTLTELDGEAPPAGGPAVVGQWDVQDSELPVRAMHTTLLSDGRVLLIAGSGNDEALFDAGSFTAVVWDPTLDSYTEIPVPYDMFCAGHVTLPDGKVLISGGTERYPGESDGPTTFDGSDQSYYFDPSDDTFHPTSDMADAHWYPTLTKLGNGDVWAAGGIDENAEGTVITELFDTATMSWLPTSAVPQTWSYWGTYPHMYLLEDGMLFYAGAHTFGDGLPGTGASLYDWQNAQIWDVPGLREKDLRDQAASVLLPPAQDQRVLIVGGGNTGANVAATNLTDVIDLSAASPQYVPGPDLPGVGKAYVNLVNLPDRSVLAANGSTHNRSGTVRTAAIYDPINNDWTPVAADPVGRTYHSTALVLPDGRVAVFGSNPGDNSFESRVSVYSPSYLFAGDRPTLTAAPEAVGYGEVVTLEATGTIASASLMAPMSSTHQTDTNARLVDLPVTGQGTLTAQIPSNSDLLPPGPYMLTVVDDAGVPSIARWVWVS